MYAYYCKSLKGLTHIFKFESEFVDHRLEFNTVVELPHHSKFITAFYCSITVGVLDTEKLYKSHLISASFRQGELYSKNIYAH